MQSIYLTESLSSVETEALKGHKMTREHYNRVITEPCRVYKPNGDLLLHLCRGVISNRAVINAWDFIDKTKQPITNRTVAAGAHRDVLVSYKGAVSNGYQTNTICIPNEVAKTLGDSSIVGYFDRYQRIPFCRQCATNHNYPKEWQKFLPFVQEINAAFKTAVPDRYRIQKAVAEATNPTWIIKDTAFTTVTVNRNFRTSTHKDSGDFEEGFGVMAYLQIGRLAGGLLVIPKFKIAVQLKHKDLLLFDVHEYHGNTVVKKEEGTQRITLVCYYRRKMIRGGTPEYEQERAKVYSQRHCLYDPPEIAVGDRKIQQILSQFK